MQAIIDEVRWELDTHGHSGVKIFLSGGVSREDVILYRHSVDAFGIGGAIANASVTDYGMDIVEINGKPKANRVSGAGSNRFTGCRTVDTWYCRLQILFLPGDPPSLNAVSIREGSYAQPI